APLDEVIDPNLGVAADVFGRGVPTVLEPVCNCTDGFFVCAAPRFLVSSTRTPALLAAAAADVLPGAGENVVFVFGVFVLRVVSAGSTVRPDADSGSVLPDAGPALTRLRSTWTRVWETSRIRWALFCCVTSCVCET